jgi:hypothetical protein
MLIYPPDIVRHDKDRPVVVFRNKIDAAENDQHIIFPVPQSVQFSDSASYNSSEIGFGGAVLMSALRSSNGTDSINNAYNTVKNSIPSNVASLAGLIAKNGTFGSNVQNAVSVASQTILNKNLVTEFTGMGTRQFSFTFKLVATSKIETNIIKEIADTFRAGLYPEGNALQLKFPPTWYINFQKGGEDIPYLPKIFETYLTSMETTYNGSGNMFHADGSPVETELRVSFTETRALTKQDVEILRQRAFQVGDFTRSFIDNDGELNNDAVVPSDINTR